jgi:hypothetical protein
MIRVFISYAHADEALRQELGKHLVSLKHQGLVEIWHDREIGAGEEWVKAIDANLKSADVILLLVSSDFLASRYCYEVEFKEALRRHESGEAVVIPVILRPCVWQSLPFGKLQSATHDGLPITKFPTLDDGFVEVVRAIRVAADKFADRTEPQARIVRGPETPGTISSNVVEKAARRSANLHVKRSFTDHDKDKFRSEAFEYIADFFENSLTALEGRNPQITSQFRRRDANSFEAAAYEKGKIKTRCGIWMSSGQFFGGDIAYSSGGLGSGNSFNESMSVADDGYILGLKPLGMASFSERRDQILTLEGAADYFWQMFIRPMQ